LHNPFFGEIFRIIITKEPTFNSNICGGSPEISSSLSDSIGTMSLSSKLVSIEKYFLEGVGIFSLIILFIVSLLLFNGHKMAEFKK
jgi:hypothetical protein